MNPNYLSFEDKLNWLIKEYYQFQGRLGFLEANETTNTTPSTIIAAGASGNTTNTTAQQNLVSVKIPGGTMTSTSVIVVQIVYNFTGTNNTKTTIVNASTTSADVSGSPTGGGAIYYSVGQINTTLSVGSLTYIFNNGSTTAQFGKNSAQGALAASSSPNAGTTSTLNTANDFYININMQLASGSDVGYVGYIIQVL